ncbi:MAG TPA: CBS domain-containing protein [Terriglobales bacterium]|nr:CBS domain-containing protein [Terriglobales bacterium]
MKIRDIMTTEIEVAEPEDTLEDVAVMMRDQDVGAIPVVEDDELIGIITDRDIVVRCVAEGKDPSEIAADEIISGDLHTITPDDDIEEARRIMADMQIRRLPVVDDGRLVGMVSLGDLAVKTDEEELVADTLEDISEGVKATDQSAARPDVGKSSAAGKGGRSQKQAQGRQESMEQTGRQQPSMRSRIEEDSEGTVDRSQETEGRVQGITSHAADEEVERQNRVVPIRSQRKSNARGKKPSGRKTG